MYTRVCVCMSDDLSRDSSESETETMSVPTTSDEESDEYGSKEKRRCKHNYDTLMVNLESHIDCERDYEHPWIPLNQMLI